MGGVGWVGKMFASVELAKRIEAAEAEMVAECARVMAARPGSAAFERQIDGGIACFCGADSPLTKAVGLGFGELPAPQALDSLEAEFFSHGAGVQVELCSLAPTPLAELLTRRGYALVGFENVLGRALGPAEVAQPSAIAIEPAQDAELEAWIEVLVEAFAARDTQGVAAHESFPRESLARTLRDMAGARGFQRYLARRAGAPAGAASMRLSAGVAQLCGAGTLPEHRRRGVQRALLERRLAAASAQGCDVAVITTLPGSKSQENAERRGFGLLYARAILRREPGR